MRLNLQDIYTAWIKYVTDTKQRRSWNKVCERISSVKHAAITKPMFEQRLAASLCVCVCACERLAGLPVHSGTGITAAVKISDGVDGSDNFTRLIIPDDFHHINVFESECEKHLSKCKVVSCKVKLTFWSSVNEDF